MRRPPPSATMSLAPRQPIGDAGVMSGDTRPDWRSRVRPPDPAPKSAAQAARAAAVQAALRRLYESQKGGPPGDETLPTKEEIGRLSRWAKVAFAVRCARRAMPWFEHGWAAATPEQVRAVESAVEWAEGVAARGETAGAFAGYADFRAATVGWVGGAISMAAAQAAWYAVSAARTAGNANYIPLDGRRLTSDALGAADFARVIERPVTAAATRRDYALLFALDAREWWTDDTPVPPAPLGPLWPDGPPAAWPPPAEGVD